MASLVLSDRTTARCVHAVRPYENSYGHRSRLRVIAVSAGAIEPAPKPRPDR